MMNPSITRRQFLKKSLAGAGMTIAISINPLGSNIVSSQEVKKDLFSPNIWVRITPDNIVTIVVNKSEMGQGVYTSLPMILADELEADWKQIRIKSAPAGDKYKDPAWGMQMTGGSTSVRHMMEPLREAGAAAREMLLAAAAQTWGVPQSECEARQGRVRHKKTDRTMTYGQLCEKASKLPIPQNPPLKQDNQFRFIGTPMARLDVPDKVNGSAIFGTDIFVPGMLYAAVARPPAYGAKLLSYDQEAAEKVSDVYKVVQIDRGLAVSGSTLDAAWKGKKALNVKWDKGSHPDLNNATLEKSFIQHLDQQGVIARNEGNVKNALSRAAKKIRATYVLPYLAHVTMEPMDCTAHVLGDRCDIWVPTQNQSGVLQVAAKITGLKPELINVYTTYLGGGFGRRSETDVVEEALQISKALGKPVKLLWTREEDIQNDFYRPGNWCKIEGGIDKNGSLKAWSHKIVVPSIFARVFPEMMKSGVDPAAVEGIANMEYEVPNLYVEYVRIDNPIPVGFWRSVGSSHNAFTVESFLDELAHAAKKDPLEFRLNLLKNHPRSRRVLEVAAEKSGWGKPLKKGRSLGIAYHFSFGSHVAQVAEVSVNKKDGTIKVHKVVCAVDCGPVVNPAIITAQMNSGIIMGLSAALKEKVDFNHGGVETANFYNYNEFRMSEIPMIDVHIVKSKEEIGGIGEPGLPPIAPAVANAVFKAAGIRLRRLPMTPENVMETIKKK
jgi:isoquinoline 1-oxidoreductase beta subunit